MASELVRLDDEMNTAGRAVIEFYRAHEHLAGVAPLSDGDAATWQRLLDAVIEASRAYAAAAAAARAVFKR